MKNQRNRGQIVRGVKMDFFIWYLLVMLCAGGFMT